MADTKEQILRVALQLFARDGYEAVSVRSIATELGMTKSALYKHYRNKRELFTSILAQMERMDREGACAYAMPCEPVPNPFDSAQPIEFQQILAYARAQFRYWVEEPFSSNFRKLLMLERFRNAEMAQLYQQYLADGPVRYLSELFDGLLGEQPSHRQLADDLALRFYAPMYYLYGQVDCGLSVSCADARLCAQWASLAADFSGEQENTMQLETNRLYLIPLRAEQLAWWLTEMPRLEQALHCHYAAEPMEGVFREIVAGQLPLVVADGEAFVWDTFWFMLRKTDRTVVGSAVWKGKPDETGTVEIGYGLGTAFLKQGYMTEALSALCAWAWQQPSVQHIVAETERDSSASQSVLQRCGFVMDRQDVQAETIWWRLEHPASPINEGSI